MFENYIKKSFGVWLVIIVLLIGGYISLRSMNISFYPDFSVPALFITTLFPGSDPETVENEVTKPIEDILSNITGLEEISSTSQEGFSLVRVSFQFGVDFDKKKDEIQKKIDLVKGTLPQQVKSPNIITINDFVASPIELAIYSDRRSESELLLIAKNRISKSISRLDGVGDVKINGGIETVVKVEIDPIRLIETQVSFNQVAQSIRAFNTDFPLGEVTGEKKSFVLRFEGKYKKLDDINNIIVSYSKNKVIFLKDIASVSIIEKSKTKYSRLNGNDSIILSIRKPSNGNSVYLVDNVKNWIKTNPDKLPKDIKISIIKDESIVIKESISNVINSLLLGALLASIIIFLILGNVRNTLIIVISIPTSIVISFIFMKLFNLSINTVSLGGLGMAVGMIVDSSIVVMENCYRYLEDTKKKSENIDSNYRVKIIANATKEVILPITASILTTVVVFFPMAFTSGFAKVLLGELSLVIVFALIVSLVISITFVPILSNKLLVVDYKANYFSEIFNKFLDFLRNIYLKILEFALSHRVITILFFISISIFSFSIVGLINTGMLPKTDQGEFQINLTYPQGYNLEWVNREVSEIENYLLKIKNIKIVNSLLGEDQFFGTKNSNIASIGVLTDRKVETDKIIGEIRNYLDKKPSLKYFIRVLDASTGITRQDIDINITGLDIRELRNYGDILVGKLKSIDGLINIKSNLNKPLDSYIFVPDKEKIASFGLSMLDVAQYIRNAKMGQIVTTYKYQGYDIDVEVKLRGSEQYSLVDLENMPISTINGIVPLKVFGNFVEGDSPVEIKRINLLRAVNITGDFSSGYQKRDLEIKVNDIIKEMQSLLKPNYFIEKRGSSKAIMESFKTLGFALIIGVILVFMVMGIQFANFKDPFIILMSIPFSFPGAFFSLFISKSELNLPSFLGLIMLAGIVVNNGIILVDFINNYFKEYKDIKKTIIEAGRIRFRPIIMTTITTILGMVFLALNIGGGGEALAPLAIAVIGGLSYSLFISLILIPVLYLSFNMKLLKENRVI